MADILITHVSIGERGIEIGYNEPRDRGDRAVLFRTIMVERELISTEVEELMDTLQIIVDLGLSNINAQPDSIPFKRHV